MSELVTANPADRGSQHVVAGSPDAVAALRIADKGIDKSGDIGVAHPRLVAERRTPPSHILLQDPAPPQFPETHSTPQIASRLRPIAATVEVLSQSTHLPPARGRVAQRFAGLIEPSPDTVQFSRVRTLEANRAERLQSSSIEMGDGPPRAQAQSASRLTAGPPEQSFKATMPPTPAGNRPDKREPNGEALLPFGEATRGGATHLGSPMPEPVDANSPVQIRSSAPHGTSEADSRLLSLGPREAAYRDLQVRLSTHDIGNAGIRMTLADDALTLTIEAPSADSAAAYREARQDLADALNSAGIAVVSDHIEVRERSQDGPARSGGSNSDVSDGKLSADTDTGENASRQQSRRGSGSTHQDASDGDRSAHNVASRRRVGVYL